jgi:hypothetical protein
MRIYAYYVLCGKHILKKKTNKDIMELLYIDDNNNNIKLNDESKISKNIN